MLGLIITILLLGALWVMAVPLAQSKIPASWMASTWGKIAVTGVFLLIVVLVVNFVAHKTRVAEAV